MAGSAQKSNGATSAGSTIWASNTRERRELGRIPRFLSNRLIACLVRHYGLGSFVLPVSFPQGLLALRCHKASFAALMEKCSARPERSFRGESYGEFVEPASIDFSVPRFCTCCAIGRWLRRRWWWKHLDWRDEPLYFRRLQY